MLSRRILRIKALKALYAHLQTEAESMMASEKSMMASIEKAYDLYFQMLALPAELVRYAESRQELARQKMMPTFEDLNPNTKFVENKVIALMDGSDSINDYLAKRKLSWSAHPEFIKLLYNQIAERDYFKSYMSREERSFNEDRALLERIYCEELQECEALDNLLEETSILWSDDLPFILIMVIRTLQNMKPSHTEVKVLPCFKNEDDERFVRHLFEKSLVNYSDHMRLIEPYLHNWDMERIAYMDMLILVTALSELIEFDSIPVKVTLDEYIEIAKFYSGPGSANFINGLLDKMISELTTAGRIVKRGRGLIDRSLK
uniref:transcription antitermination protein NusB n=1 Tax=Alistipes sp. TaxID=1872444 RepID=UPI004057B568